MQSDLTYTLQRERIVGRWKVGAWRPIRGLSLKSREKMVVTWPRAGK